MRFLRSTFLFLLLLLSLPFVALFPLALASLCLSLFSLFSLSLSRSASPRRCQKNPAVSKNGRDGASVVVGGDVVGASAAARARALLAGAHAPRAPRRSVRSVRSVRALASVRASASVRALASVCAVAALCAVAAVRARCASVGPNRWPLGGHRSSSALCDRPQERSVCAHACFTALLWCSFYAWRFCPAPSLDGSARARTRTCLLVSCRIGCGCFVCGTMGANLTLGWAAPPARVCPRDRVQAIDCDVLHERERRRRLLAFVVHDEHPTEPGYGRHRGAEWPRTPCQCQCLRLTTRVGTVATVKCLGSADCSCSCSGPRARPKSSSHARSPSKRRSTSVRLCIAVASRRWMHSLTPRTGEPRCIGRPAHVHSQAGRSQGVVRRKHLRRRARAAAAAHRSIR